MFPLKNLARKGLNPPHAYQDALQTVRGADNASGYLVERCTLIAILLTGSRVAAGEWSLTRASIRRNFGHSQCKFRSIDVRIL